MVKVRNEAKGTWDEAKGSGILVIVPGAGTHANRKAYNELERHFDVIYRDTPTRRGGFRYPAGWANITSVPLDTDPPDSLMGLSRSIGGTMKASPPALVICGSRGGQVVVPILLAHYWRGPFVAINAGPLTSNGKIPEGCFPLFVTCGKDYFPTSDLGYVTDRFKEVSDVQGLNVFLPSADHMPELSKPFLAQLARHLLHGTALPANLTVRPLSPSSSASSYPFTVDHHKGAPNTLLRKEPTSHHKWYVDRRGFDNGSKVRILKQGMDENNYEMVYATDGTVRGWLYSINISQLRDVAM